MLLAQRKRSQFPTFLQETVRLNAFPMVNPTVHTDERQDASREEGVSILNCCRDRWNILHIYRHTRICILHIFTTVYIPDIPPPAHPHACTRVMFIRQHLEQAFGPLPFFWIFMSTCFLPKTHETTNTTLLQACIRASARLCTSYWSREDHLNLKRWNTCPR